MPNDEQEFETSIADLSPEEQTSKRLEFKATKADDYREKLNIQNKVLKEAGYEWEVTDGKGHWNKKTVQTEPVAPITSLAPMDAVLIAKSDIATEDIQTVIDYANFIKKPVSEAMNDATLRTIIKTRAEERTTAAATNIKVASRTAPRDTAESIIDAASQGQVPDSDEGIERLAQARIEQKKARKQR